MSQDYRCRYFFMHCKDPRIQETVERLRVHLGIEFGTFDRVSVAGGAGNLPYLREESESSVRLHSTTFFILTVHEDCGAGATEEHLAEAKKIAEQYPHESILLFSIGLDGTWKQVE